MQNNTEDLIRHLRRVADAMNIGVADEQCALFGRYYEFLLEYNQKVNLTRITEPMEVAAKHFGDSLAVLKANDFFSECSVVDVGAGAGFPGMPIAIMRPDIRITLMDSLRKKTVFLSEAVQKLELQNVQVVWARAEEMGHNPLYRERFDIVLARAVAPLNVLVELCLPLLRTGGFFLAMKGPKAKEELTMAQGAIRKLGGFVISTVTDPLPLVGEVRTLIRIGKKYPMSDIYPRKAGVPARQPLT